MPLLTRDPIDVAALMAAHARASDGALAVFVGIVRDHDHGRRVVRMMYEGYEPMAEAELAKIAADAETRCPDVRLTIRHRLGWLEIGEAAVAILASSPHRAEAFAACREAIEAIKVRVPIWKKEVGPDGESWVEGCGVVEVKA